MLVPAGPSSSTWCDRLIEPRLHTAVSSADVTSRISVHRFDRWITLPGLAVWLPARLQVSLNVIQPFPVCASVRIIRAYSSRARIVFTALPCASACARSEEHTSELQSLLRISYAV